MSRSATGAGVKPIAPTMIASLPMYLNTIEPLEKLWCYLAPRLASTGGNAVPQQLVWPTDYAGHWLSPDLLLSQACGFPLVSELAGKVRVVGTFRYRADGCDGIFCRSKLVVRSHDTANTLADFRGRTVAYNSTNSQSGYNSLRALVAPLAQQGKFFGDRVEGGSHRKSVELVRDGLADIASIDCVSLAALEKYSPEVTRGIRALGYSDPYPGLPLITAAQTSDAVLASLRSALAQAMHDPALGATREALFIEGFEPVELSAYQVCTTMRDRAYALGCRSL